MDNNAKRLLTSLSNEVKGIEFSVAEIVKRINAAIQNADNEDEDTEKYEAMRQKDILSRLEKRLTKRDININTVIEWAQLSENIIRQKLYARSTKRTSTFWAVDVMRFLCDIWGLTPPDTYYKECRRNGINPHTGNYELNRKTA